MSQKKRDLAVGFSEALHKNWLLLLELTIIVFFALWVGRKYLDFDANRYIEGGEFVLSTISHHAWNLLPKCGSCIFWNGYLDGGAPSFVELHGAFLHPLVVVTTLLWGVINGSKVIIIVCLITIGLSQWWLARELKLSLLPRLWVALMAIAGGHVFGKLQAGNVVLVLSIACSSLILPMILKLKRETNARNMSILAVILSLTWLSGQGYYQLVVVLAYFPAVLWYLAEKQKPHLKKWVYFITTLGISVLLISVLLVPFLHFQENWQKLLSFEMDSVQPLKYSALNLVINDWKFFDNTTLEKTVSPWAHINFIGWTPILLMLAGLVFLGKSSRKREVVLMFATALLSLLFSSKDPYSFFASEEFAAQLRSLNVATGLAIQPILLIAAVSLQELIDRKWLDLELTVSAGNFSKKVPVVKWVILLGCMIFSVQVVYNSGSRFLNTRPISIPEQELALLDTESAQWIGPLNYDWIPTLIERGKKVSIPDRPWSWSGRTMVKPYLAVHDSANNPNPEGVIKTLGGLYLSNNPGEEYARISHEGFEFPCQAISQGGQIDVVCDSEHGGTLQVREYYLQGWYAWEDGSLLRLEETADFLTVTAKPGRHTYQFRYKPWDVYLGLALSSLGLILCVVLIIKNGCGLRRNQKPTNE